MAILGNFATILRQSRNTSRVLYEHTKLNQATKKKKKKKRYRSPSTDEAPGTVQVVEQHDGSKIALRKIDADYDAHDRVGAMTFLQKHAAKGQIVTGLLYVDPELEDLHNHLDTVDTPLNRLDETALCPGSAALDKINSGLR